MATDSEVSLTHDQRCELSGIAQSGSLPAGSVFRTKLILMLAERACFNTIKRQLQTSPSTIIRSAHWSCRKLAGALGVSKDAVYRVWTDAGLKPHRLEPYWPATIPISNARRDEWHHVNSTVYPCVPGHDIVGGVTKRGADVSRFDVGDVMGVGCVVDADHTCPNCRDGFDQFCQTRPIPTTAPTITVRPQSHMADIPTASS